MILQLMKQQPNKKSGCNVRFVEGSFLILFGKANKTEINLETDEKVKLVIDDACEFKVWGERNEEGTMVIKHDLKGEDN